MQFKLLDKNHHQISAEDWRIWIWRGRAGHVVDHNNMKIDVLTMILQGKGIKVTPDQCIAHLKLLEVFYQLREDIGNTEGLFGIADPVFSPEDTSDSSVHAQDARALGEVRVREKRWAVYVERAVDRFAKWWEFCVPTTLQGAPSEMINTDDLCKRPKIDRIGFEGIPIRQLASGDYLPPIGKYGLVVDYILADYK